MTATFLEPPRLLPDAGRVLWRAGTPPSKAGRDLEKSAQEAVSMIAETMTPGVGILTGKRLPTSMARYFAPHLGRMGNVTVLVATLGPGIDEHLGLLLSRRETLMAHMFNSAASESVELLAAWAQMREASRHPGMDPTKRLAPGYSGVPLEAQPLIVGLFPGLGVTCTESHYLVPSKTLTGVWGWVLRKGL
ncbi:MAG: hypothetical protein R6V62_08005 [Candidatus Fermentibacteraceae bacterium]